MTERMLLAQARAEEAAARARREVLERELGVAAAAKLLKPRRKASRPAFETSLSDIDRAKAQRLAREMGIPVQRRVE